MISCTQHSPDKGIKSESYKPDIKICDNPDIIGNWTMCSTFDNGNMTQYNVCPIVSFKVNGSGSVGNTLISMENFRWTLKREKLTIKYDDKAASHTFPDTMYVVNLNKQHTSMDLVIIPLKKDYRYYLSK